MKIKNKNSLMNFTILLIILTLVIKTHLKTTNYTRLMTKRAFYVQDDIYIDELDFKKCKGRGFTYNIPMCTLYCKYYYSYVPSAPYKNLADFDS